MKPPAYVISAVHGFLDQEKVGRYAESAEPSIQQFGGHFVVSNAEPAVVEGETSARRVSMVVFPSMQAVKTWYASPEYAAARAVSPEAFDGRVLLLVEGLPEER